MSAYGSLTLREANRRSQPQKNGEPFYPFLSTRLLMEGATANALRAWLISNFGKKG